ncbi:hypothetical protein SCUP515_01431 [Seiridium cupressi]
MEQPKEQNGLSAQIKGRLDLIRLILPRVPYVLRVVLLHILGVSETAKYLDLKSDATIAFLRHMLGHSKPQPISKTQATTLKDSGVQGRIWISTVASQVPPEPSIRDALLAAINAMKSDLVSIGDVCRMPEILPVEAEWTGYRAAATRESKPPGISEEDKYHEMMKEVRSAVTVLYFHGGAYYLCDPSTHRPTCKKLAKLTKGRVYSVRYRLAPQSFPSWRSNLKWDYLPPPNLLAEKNTPPDSIWPASPPRKHIYVDDAYLLHPLASLQLAESWKGSPPIYVCTGWECLADEDRFLVSKLSRDGVAVTFEEYEAMPHVFAPILGHTSEAKRCFDGWAQFIAAAVENPKSLKSNYTLIKAKTCDESEIEAKTVSPFTDEDVRRLAFDMVGRKSSFAETPAKL